MSRTPSASSITLERAMNMQVRVMTFEEHLRHSKVIDKLDDKRRTKAFNLTKWHEDMNKSFQKKLIELVKTNDPATIQDKLATLTENIQEFNSSYLKLRKKVEKDELAYEEMDDEVHNWLLEYAVECRQKLRIESSEIEKKLIQENLHKKK